MSTIFNRLAESFSSTWRLLSDTTNFLSRIKLQEKYETELRDWRARLSRGRNNPQVLREVREEVVALRTLLREQGHDLRLCYQCHGQLDYNNKLIAPYTGSTLCLRCHQNLKL